MEGQGLPPSWSAAGPVPVAQLGALLAHLVKLLALSLHPALSLAPWHSSCLHRSLPTIRAGPAGTLAAQAVPAVPCAAHPSLPGHRQQTLSIPWLTHPERIWHRNASKNHTSLKEFTPKFGFLLFKGLNAPQPVPESLCAVGC